jgi:D-sedoheptulose 7-phosphate isomerase
MTAFQRTLDEALTTLESLREMEDAVDRIAKRCLASLRSGAKLMMCGNGGSAAEAMHLAAELAGRYKQSRKPLSAIALGTNPVVSSCIGNDFDFQEVFSRELEALGRRGDLLLVFSTSGNSPNILRALTAARELGIVSIAFLGRDGGQAQQLADESLVVRHHDTARIQEGHQFLLHCLMDLLEEQLTTE